MEISFISISFSLFTLLISFSALFGIYKIGINYLNGIAMLIIYFSLMVFVYRAKYISALIQTVLYIAFMIAGEYIVIPLATVLYELNGVDYHLDLHSYLFVVVSSKIIHFICVIIMLMCLKNMSIALRNTLH